MTPTNSASTTHSAAERLQIACELFEAGIALERQRIRRAYPQLRAAEVEVRWLAWLHRVGEPGDAEGSIRPWPWNPDEPTA